MNVTKKGGGRSQAPTVEQINADILTQLASEYWAPHSHLPRRPFDPKVIEDVYQKELIQNRFAIRRVMLLEFSQYLENYLWPNYSPDKASKTHVISILVMINEKFREGVQPWEACKAKPEHFAGFFRHVMELCLEEDAALVGIKEQTILMGFLIHCFNSLEVDLIREQVQRLVSLPMWVCLLPGRLEKELQAYPKYKKFWNIIKKSDAKADEKTKAKNDFERKFLSQLIQRFYRILDSIPETGSVQASTVHYCERFVELAVDLEAQLPTRRFLNVVLDDSHVVVRCRLSKLALRKEGKLFNQLLDMLAFYTGFEISDSTGTALTDHQMTDLHYDKMSSLQRAAFKLFEDLRRFSLSNVASVDTRKALSSHFEKLTTSQLHQFAAHLHLLPPLPEGTETVYEKEFLLELMVSRHERRQSQIQVLNETPLYPTEEVLWDENVVPTEYFSGEGCLALPKLNLQMLTLHDYLLRNFNLFRLESMYEIRQDLEDAILRMKPWIAENGETFFGGWARMAQPIAAFSVVEVAKPNIGENHPASVRADVTITLNLRQQIKQEWEALRKHDVAFLISVRPTKKIGTKFNLREEHFIEAVGLVHVRGCEVEGMLNEEGRVIEDGPEPRPELPGSQRTYRVWLDPNQYQQDMAGTAAGGEDVYESFNIIMRRKPKENNFKAVLETIRNLMNTDCVVPDWLHDIILGYGDPGAAHYSQMEHRTPTLDWNDTFLSLDHLRASFPDHDVKVTTEDPAKQKPPFRITFPVTPGGGKKRKQPGDDGTEQKQLVVEPHVIPNRGPYPYNQPKRNAIPFTPTQIEAIKAGMQPGLTMVVGPPGTGKTDVAVQIISNIYHNFPSQRTLIVTHSNQALNQLFEKIMALDIDERHLLRLGHGEEALETEKDFSRYGRVNYVLALRLELLKEVERLQRSLGVIGDVSYTCETAGHFFLYQVVARWEKFLSKVKPSAGGKTGSTEAIQEHFPFHKYFENAPQPVFRGRTFEEDMDIAEGCYRHIKKIFQQLEEFRAFELLRSGLDRSKYLMIKEAKIIAMTCTHAALKRHDLVDINFQYDNILMEESAQILEIETFIPLLLQNPEDGFSRLKRWIMIGDHHQLPPVIKNMAFQKYSNMEQSLFTRFVRLGVPTVDLDAQGRAKPSIATLYNWRYKKLGNLPHVHLMREFHMTNPGFQFDFQLINVEDFNGVGESEPNPYFYQNLAEAEYVVAVFMYMRLLGYPAEKISILTTYNGQKHLIRDVINQRCASNPLIGQPSKVTTVDRFQGQQNDYILLSLVRTRAVGHLRDVRRLVVAMSRARLGLYVFARVSLFQNCYELSPTFNLLLERPLQLHLQVSPSEMYPPTKKVDEPRYEPPLVIRDMPQMARFVYDFYQDEIRILQAKHGYQRQMQAQLVKPPVSRDPCPVKPATPERPESSGRPDDQEPSEGESEDKGEELAKEVSDDVAATGGETGEEDKEENMEAVETKER
ncbi:intron-binding protein aquarius-like [Acanthaster planci]|uniref:RNA helicase aquarius n=1 Tax=Acanthaster planci TaxID=133434 RepID=A0A8B7YBA3_ACAPL|nr:intron-binding protein aquarius-like [Acanthaster planci]XP_022090525.1 intron-binding protein aquarius-like [Acanthaster planci]XP_022090526.1 intron-binding protein aquarius-like [Acanthaster planci]